MSWITQETRCRGRRERDGKKCKNMVGPGKYLCEHHDLDIRAFVSNPGKCIAIMHKRFPKNHHPACDRKGQNDCSCPDKTVAELTRISVKKAFATSASLGPLYRRKRNLEMMVKTKKIRDYYNTITTAELWLPPYAGFRQFRFFVWDSSSETMVVRVIKDNFKDKATLLKWLRNLAPLHVYYTTSAWLNPQGIGPDPNGKRGKAKFKKKGWKLRRYHNTWLWQELYFDVDYDNKDLEEGANTVLDLIDWLNPELKDIHNLPHRFKKTIFDCHNSYLIGGKPSNPTIVYSGSKGYHLIFYDQKDNGQRISVNGTHSPEDSEEIIEETPNFYARDFDRMCRAWRRGIAWEDTSDRLAIRAPEKRMRRLQILKEDMCNQLRADGIMLDYEVTSDPRRIIRLPGTVHGKTLNVCKIVPMEDLHHTDRYVENIG